MVDYHLMIVNNTNGNSLRDKGRLNFVSFGVVTEA